MSTGRQEHLGRRAFLTSSLRPGTAMTLASAGSHRAHMGNIAYRRQQLYKASK